MITEDNKEGSIISEVAAIIAENCLFDLDAPLSAWRVRMSRQCHMLQQWKSIFMINPDKVEEGDAGIG